MALKKPQKTREPVNWGEMIEPIKENLNRSVRLWVVLALLAGLYGCEFIRERTSEIYNYIVNSPELQEYPPVMFQNNGVRVLRDGVQTLYIPTIDNIGPHVEIWYITPTGAPSSEPIRSRSIIDNGHGQINFYEVEDLTIFQAGGYFWYIPPNGSEVYKVLTQNQNAFGGLEITTIIDLPDTQ